ncbi:MAG: hypothetical protein KAH04_05505 [Psychrilyobacter sp.]|nr:hypothetical protein [Psychrilyobacter sp.]
MSTLKFRGRDPIKPLFAIKVSPTMHKVLETIPDDEDKINLIKTSLDINPKRVVGLKYIVDGEKNNGTIVVLFDYIYEHISPKFEIPFDEDGTFKFKIYDVDFNKPINIEKILKKL